MAYQGELDQPGGWAPVDWLLVVGSVLVVLLALFLSPGGLLDKADHVGYAVCHQISVRSYILGDRQLPLCARCSGQYLGALGAMVFLLARGRGRAVLMPPAKILLILAVFLAIWAFDGLNSYLTLFPGAPHLYQPHNLLRVTTGGLQGVALVALVLPFFNSSLWAVTERTRSVANLREVAVLLLMVAAIVLLVSSEIAVLLYPLALLSVGGTLMMLTLVNTMLAVIVLRREALARSWRDVMPLILTGLALAVVELAVINLVRASLTAAFGLPF